MKTLNQIQIEILKQMINWGEYSYSSDWLEDIKINGVVVTKKFILREMKTLRELGLIRMYRGGINEDGEVVGGTHFDIPYAKRKEVGQMIANEDYSNY